MTSTYLWLAVLAAVGIMLPPRDQPPLWYAIAELLLLRGRPVAPGGGLGVKPAVLRAVVVACVVAFAYHGAFTEFVAFCEGHRAWRRVTGGASPVIRDGGFGVARAGDAIFSCETSHCFDGMACHEDLECICAPATLGALQVGAMLAVARLDDRAGAGRDGGRLPAAGGDVCRAPVFRDHAAVFRLRRHRGT